MNENENVIIDITISYLPVGSVVMLKEAKQPILIIGYGVIEEGKSQVWDYLGAPWPMGVIASDRNLLFNNDQIEKVIAEGYSDDKEKEFRFELENQMVVIKSKK